jgi:hypothetical protein
MEHLQHSRSEDDSHRTVTRLPPLPAGYALPSIPDLNFSHSFAQVQDDWLTSLVDFQLPSASVEVDIPAGDAAQMAGWLINQAGQLDVVAGDTALYCFLGYMSLYSQLWPVFVRAASSSTTIPFLHQPRHLTGP